MEMENENCTRKVNWLKKRTDLFIIKCNNKLVLETLNRALKRDFEALF